MRVGLIICCYNRPQYLSRCLASIKNADLSQLSSLLIVDDKSTNDETVNLINQFREDRVELIKAFSEKNRSIKGSLLFGYDLLFADCDIVMNLDSDAIVAPNFIEILLSLKSKFPENIVCGFNTTVKNRNPILEEYHTYFKKKYASGINMVLSNDDYQKYVRPALNGLHNWDFESSKAHEKGGKAVIVAKPSVIQHIGLEESSMGHISASEPPDVAEDFIDEDEMKLFKSFLYKYDLRNVTLIAVDDNVEGIIKAADISCREIEFGAVKLLSSMPSNDKRVVPIRHLGSRKEYSIFLMKEIFDYIDTEYFMTIQADGFILRAESWRKEWLNYDYIGAGWHFHKDSHNVGNGAASLRSTRLHKILKEDDTIVPTNDHLIKDFEEDHNICRIYRSYLEEAYGIKFAPLEEADKFGIEAWGRDNKKYNNEFCFHGKNIDFKGAQLTHIPY